jgi:protein gp37
MKNTRIGWCNHTFNCWVGCTMISEGCVFCYASALEVRWGRGAYDKKRERVRTSEDYWKQPLRWDKEAADIGIRYRVFCASMADVFDERVDPQWRMDLFDLIARCPHLDWLLLTKRPEVALGALPHKWPNIWLGVSVETQKRAEERIPVLMKCPSVVRFLSVEPLIERVYIPELKNIDWVIVGGESGPKHRPMEVEWAREIKQRCESLHVPFFMKQLGGHPSKKEDLADFPEDLRIRQFPSTVGL